MATTFIDEKATAPGAEASAAETGSIATTTSSGGPHKGPVVNLKTVPEESFFAIDAFTAAAGHDGDHVDFRSMGWLKAGLVATAEVS